MGFEHEIEMADVGEITFTAARTRYGLFPDERDQFLLRHGFHGNIVHMIFTHIFFNEFIGTVTHFAVAAVDQGVMEGGHVSGCNPYPRIHQNGGVQSHVVGILLYKFFPPCPFDVIFKFHAQRAVIPTVRQTAVNFTSGENKSPSLAQRNQLFHGFFPVIHTYPAFS